MKIAATELHETLRVAMLGTAQNEAIEALTHVFFTGSVVYGYDGSVYCEHVLKSDIKGSVRAETLWTVVDALAAQSKGDADVIVEDKELRVRIGRSFLRAPLNPADTFEVPDVKKTGVVIKGAEQARDMCTAFQRCVAVSDAVGHYAYARGVVVHVSGSNVLMYGTDSSKLARCVVQLKSEDKLGLAPIIVPYRAVQIILQLGAIVGGDDHFSMRLRLSKEQVVCEVLLSVDKEIRVIARMISPTISPDEELPDFESTIKQHLPKREGVDLDKVAGDIHDILSRARKLIAAELQRFVKVTVKDGKTTFTTNTARGEKLRESVDAALLVEGTECYVDVDGFLQALEHGHSLRLTSEHGATFTGKSYTYLIPTVPRLS
jgi:DNA polymerase III sliding clamp (beta) subunit (PCNA family)